MIRFIIGLFLVYGGVGGIENDTDLDNEMLFLQLIIIAVGLSLMYFGTKQYKQ
jgi:hypothetical protein